MSGMKPHKFSLAGSYTVAVTAKKNGVAIDLTGKTIVLRMKKQDDSEATFLATGLTTAVTSAADGQFTITIPDYPDGVDTEGGEYWFGCQIHDGSTPVWKGSAPYCWEPPAEGDYTDLSP